MEREAAGGIRRARAPHLGKSGTPAARPRAGDLTGLAGGTVELAPARAPSNPGSWLVRASMWVRIVAADSRDPLLPHGGDGKRSL